MTQPPLSVAGRIFSSCWLAAGMAFIAVTARAQTPVAPAREILTVDRPDDDDASGSLRWAVKQNNAEPGHYRIRVGGGVAPLHILLKNGLPPLASDTIIEGVSHDRGLGYDTIDGSGYIAYDVKSCPGMAPGQFGANVRTLNKPGLAVIDQSRVAISGLEITHFCIGVLVLRSDHVTIQNNRISRNVGGAGVMFTGDDGAGNVVPGRTVNNRLIHNELFANGDGAELTRGAAFNLFAENVFDAGDNNPEPSQGVEVLLGDDNVLARNEFRNYSDGIQINNGNRNYLVANVLHANTFGLSLTGVGNVADSNDIYDNRFGVVVRSQREAGGAWLTRNIIRSNGKPIVRCYAGGSCDPLPDHGAVGIVFRSAPVPPGNGAPPAQTVVAANALPAAPRLTAITAGPEPSVTGVALGRAQSATTIELFGGARPGDADAFLGSVTIPAGTGDQPFAVPLHLMSWPYLTATATLLTSGVTSSFAEPFPGTH
ncbi:MAG TPA: right-handed parallel beta-helix repeat-containing protein [Caulobacteraceae bacterium]|nr:right-handed parallel beta-helix repeat-containing protein [Caulobacteraceae bacterium]